MEKLKKWSLIAEIFTALAVVFSIAYLALEIKQNTNAIQAQTSQGLLEMINQSSLAVASNKELATLYIKGNEDLASLTPVERFQYTEFLYTYLDVWEHAFYSQDSMVKGLWEAYDNSYKAVYCIPSSQILWGEISVFFGQEFQDHVDAISEEDCVPFT